MQTERPTTRSWRAIAGYARPHWKSLVAGGLLLTIGGLVSLVQPLVARRIVDALSDDKTIRDPIILLVGLIVAGALISAFGSYLLERTAESVVRGARMRLIDKILWLRLPSMEQTNRAISCPGSAPIPPCCGRPPPTAWSRGSRSQCCWSVSWS